MSGGVWEQTGPTVTLPPEAIGIQPWPRKPGAPLFVESASGGTITLTGEHHTYTSQGRRFSLENIRERFHGDPAYRLLALWHRRSWRTKLAELDRAERRMRARGLLP